MKTTLKQIAEQIAPTNPLDNIPNISQYGGADVMWHELIRRYGDFYVYRPETFQLDLSAVFVYNDYKYNKLHSTIIQQYNMLYNMDYTATRSGEDTLKKTGTISDVGTASDALTDTLHITEVKTGGHSDTNVKTGNRELQNTETVTHGKTTTTNGYTGGYTDTVNTSETVLNDETPKLKTIVQTTHAPDIESQSHIIEQDGGTTSTSASGSETYGNITDAREIVYNSEQTQTTHSGGNTRAKSDNNSRTLNTADETEYNSATTYRGYNKRPQEAIEEERNIAMFSLMVLILSDIRKELLYYIN